MLDLPFDKTIEVKANPEGFIEIIIPTPFSCGIITLKLDKSEVNDLIDRLIDSVEDKL